MKEGPAPRIVSRHKQAAQAAKELRVTRETLALRSAAVNYIVVAGHKKNVPEGALLAKHFRACQFPQEKFRVPELLRVARLCNVTRNAEKGWTLGVRLVKVLCELL